MKTTFLLMTLATMVFAQKSVHDFTMNDISGNKISLSKFKGKKMLLVNVASNCGYTGQYDDLQKLSEKYASKVAVLGFPANNFGGQEPGSNSDIASFCKKNYGVTFPMFEKISVKGSDAHELYKFLSEKSGKAPGWNFCKYLVDENGNILKFFDSGTNPLSEDITKLL
jgi:glutathione peroxidase